MVKFDFTHRCETRAKGMESAHRTLSISCTSNSVVSTLSQYGPKGIEILDIGELDEPLAISSPNHISDNAKLSAQLLGLAESSRTRADRLHLSLPSSSVHYRILPGLHTAGSEVLSELLELEMMHAREIAGMVSLSARLVPLHYSDLPENGVHEGQTLVLISDAEVEFCVRELAATMGYAEVQIRSSFECAEQSFRYNYPEKRNQNVALVSIDEHELTVGLYGEGRLNYLHNVDAVASAECAETLCTVLDEMLEQRVPELHTVALYGFDISPLLIRRLKAGLDSRVREVERLNAFRMCQSAMDDAHRKYAALYAHRYAVCVGNALPVSALATEIIQPGQRAVAEAY